MIDKWLIPDVLPLGLCVIAGGAKIGKSYFSLQTALAVAQGSNFLGKPITKGDVLYLDMNDGERRLVSRVHQLVQDKDKDKLTNFQYAVDWPRNNKGGLEAIEDWFETHSHARLVVIDLLVNYIDSPEKGWYQNYYNTLRSLKALADNNPKIAIVVIHHTKKGLTKKTIKQIERNGLSKMLDIANSVVTIYRKRFENTVEYSLINKDKSVVSYDLFFAMGDNPIYSFIGEVAA